MAIEASYQQITSAVMALRLLGNEKLGADAEGKPAPLLLPLRTALKIKRMLGLLMPLAVQAQQQVDEMRAAAKVKEGAPQPPALAKKIEELYAVTCAVGSETLGFADLEGLTTAQARLGLVLADLGPFWADDAAPA